MLSLTLDGSQARAPRAPDGLRADLAGGSVRLTWTPVRGARVRRYLVYRRRLGAETRARLIARRRNARMTDRRVRPGARYRYWLRAIDRAGRRSRRSRRLLVRIPPVPSGPRPASPVEPPRPPLGPPARFVAADGSDTGACGADDPCRSLGYAHAQALPGDVVAVAPGRYPPQAVDPVPRSSSEPVVFTGTPGTHVGELRVRAAHVEFRDLTTAGWYVGPGARDVTLRAVTAQGAVFVTSSDRVRVLGGSVGPGDSHDSQVKASDTSGAPVPSGIVFDGVDFHDWTRRADRGAHVECLQIGAVDGLVVRNSVFRRCATQGLFLRPFGGTATIRDVVIENNVFDRTAEGFYAIKVGDTDGVVSRGIAVRYNSSLQPFAIDPGAAEGVEFVGNVAPRSRAACSSGGRYAFNVWHGARCSPTDRNAAPRFVDPGLLDLRPKRRSPAIGAGDQADFPAIDFDRSARPSGRVDAGAFER